MTEDIWFMSDGVDPSVVKSFIQRLQDYVRMNDYAAVAELKAEIYRTWLLHRDPDLLLILERLRNVPTRVYCDCCTRRIFHSFTRYDQRTDVILTLCGECFKQGHRFGCGSY